MNHQALREKWERHVVEALRQLFAKMRLTCAGRQDDQLRWSGDDLATDLAPYVAAALERAYLTGVTDGGTGIEWLETDLGGSVLNPLRGAP